MPVQLTKKNAGTSCNPDGLQKQRSPTKALLLFLKGWPCPFRLASLSRRKLLSRISLHSLCVGCSQKNAPARLQTMDTAPPRLPMLFPAPQNECPTPYQNSCCLH